MTDNDIQDEQPDDLHRENPNAGVEENPTPEGHISNATPDADTFDREYVEKLRQENAGHRTKLRGVQERLHRVLVEQTGQLADPADLPFDPAHLDDTDALAAAIDALLVERPHLRARRFESGAAEQGPKSNDTGQVNLADLMRGML